MTSADLAGAVEVLARGGVVCFPTETFYGLAANALDEAAVARVVAAKGRVDKQPIAVIVANIDAAMRVWADLPHQALALAGTHWPGPLTIVLPAAAGVPAALVGPQGGVGVRISSHPGAYALAAAFGGPITATSANLTGGTSTRTAAEARAQLGDAVDLYLDDGTTPGGPASTVIDFDPSGAPRVIKQGAIIL